MEIQLEVGQIGVIGNFVTSNRGRSGRRHFVTPRFNMVGMNSYNQIWKIALLGNRATGRAPTMADPASAGSRLGTNRKPSRPSSSALSTSL